MSSVDRDIGQLIRKAREHLRLTVEDIAEELGLSADQILRYEFGENRPSPQLLLALCTILRVQPSWFFPEIPAQEKSSAEELLGLPHKQPDYANATDHGGFAVSRGRIDVFFAGGVRISVGREFDEVTFRRLFAILRSVQAPDTVF